MSYTITSSTVNYAILNLKGRKVADVTVFEKKGKIEISCEFSRRRDERAVGFFFKSLGYVKYEDWTACSMVFKSNEIHDVDKLLKNISLLCNNETISYNV